jgi:hypothetical protein
MHDRNAPRLRHPLAFAVLAAGVVTVGGCDTVVGTADVIRSFDKVLEQPASRVVIHCESGPFQLRAEAAASPLGSAPRSPVVIEGMCAGWGEDAGSADLPPGTLVLRGSFRGQEGNTRGTLTFYE